MAAREISHTPLLATAKLMDVLYSNNPSDYTNTAASGGSSSVRTVLFNPGAFAVRHDRECARGRIGPQRRPDLADHQPDALSGDDGAQPGSQVYGGAAGDTYLVYPGAVPCSDSTNSNRTVYCVARVDARADARRR